ncbi:MAG: PD-(D/E)XK nuclease family protein, partial [Terriglobia bacterium]
IADLPSALHNSILAGKAGDYPRSAQQLAEVFLGSDLGRRSRTSPRAGREWEFIADVGGTLVRGSIDLWFEENGDIYVVDYKTDRKPDADAYRPQLALYALALERALGKRPVGAYLHFLRPDIVVEVPIDQAALDSAQSLIGQLGAAQNSLEFDLREGVHCHSCQYYKTLCPAQA